MRKILLLVAMCCCIDSYAQRTLTLDQAVAIACDSSLTAFRSKNLYMRAYWQYKSFKAEMRPSLTWNITPADFSRYLTKRYNYNENIDEYREQKLYSAGTGLRLSQNFLPIGGSFYVETNLNYLKNFGENKSEQFSGVPIMIGYSHNVLGFNEFKWNRKIEPLQYEKNKIEYLANTQDLAIETMNLFFQTVSAQKNRESAMQQLHSSDSLLALAERRKEYLTVSKSDLISLQADVLSARNRLAEAEISYFKAKAELLNFLRIESTQNIELVMPEAPKTIDIDAGFAVEMARKYSVPVLERQLAVLEAEKNLDEVIKSTRFNAQVNASAGFNQVADNVGGVYKKPMEQDLLMLSLQIPILDWGKGKGKRNIAKSELEIARIEISQEISKVEQTVVNYVEEVKLRCQIVANNYESLKMAEDVYAENIKNFQNGTIDITALSMAQSKLESAQTSYLSSVTSYWQSFCQLRKLTLYDFEKGVSLSEQFDFDNL